MPKLTSRLDPRSAAFAANAERMVQRLAEVLALQAKVVSESASKRAKFDERGQLLPRERVARLIDPGSEWRLHRQWFTHSAMGDLLGDREADHTIENSQLVDVDLVKAYSEFKTMEVGAQAALQSYASIQKLSLFQYLS